MRPGPELPFLRSPPAPVADWKRGSRCWKPGGVPCSIANRARLPRSARESFESLAPASFVGSLCGPIRKVRERPLHRPPSPWQGAIWPQRFHASLGSDIRFRSHTLDPLAVGHLMEMSNESFRFSFLQSKRQLEVMVPAC